VLPCLPDGERRPLGIGEDGHPAGVQEVEGLRHDAPAGIANLGRGLVGTVDPEAGVPHRRRRRSLGYRSDGGDIAAAQFARRVKNRRACRLAPRDEVVALRVRRQDVLELPPEQTAIELKRRLGVGLAHIHPAGDAGDVSVALGHRYSPFETLTDRCTLSPLDQNLVLRHDSRANVA
jgi:hypothetical protein